MKRIIVSHIIIQNFIRMLKDCGIEYKQVVRSSRYDDFYITNEDWNFLRICCLEGSFIEHEQETHFLNVVRQEDSIL